MSVARAHGAQANRARIRTRRFVSAITLLILPAVSCSQEPWGAITGVVRSGRPVADATVEAKNIETGAVHSTTTDVGGFILSRAPWRGFE